MNFREQQELFEAEQLSSFACLSKDSRGRAEAVEPCPLVQVLSALGAKAATVLGAKIS